MSNKLFVGNLSFNTTENALQDAFAAHGTVTETNLMMDRLSGRPRGFGFVTMSTPEEAQKAIAALNLTVAPSRSTLPARVKNARLVVVAVAAISAVVAVADAVNSAVAAVAVVANAIKRLFLSQRGPVFRASFFYAARCAQRSLAGAERGLER